MNVTKPNGTPRSDSNRRKVELTTGHARLCDYKFSKEIEMELNQWRACAEKLVYLSDHAPRCLYRGYLGNPPYPCDCGLKETLEMFEKLKTAWPTGYASRLHPEAEKRLPFDHTK